MSLVSKEIIMQFLNEIKKEIIEEQERTNRVATRKSINSYEVEVKGQEAYISGQLIGVGYFKFIENGRAGGKFPPLRAILEWGEAKGVIGVSLSESKKRGLAFVIARKIAEKGTLTYQAGGAGLLSKITDERLTALRESILQYGEKEIVSQMLNSFAA